MSGGLDTSTIDKQQGDEWIQKLQLVGGRISNDVGGRYQVVDLHAKLLRMLELTGSLKQ